MITRFFPLGTRRGSKEGREIKISISRREVFSPSIGVSVSSSSSASVCPRRSSETANIIDDDSDDGWRS